jgi:hypothetical protein
MKIYNTDGEVLNLGKTRLSITIDGEPFGFYPCTNILKLADLKRALILSKKYEAWVPVLTKYAACVVPQTLFREVSRTGRQIGCQTFDPANWRKIMSALTKVKATSLKVARTW